MRKRFIFIVILLAFAGSYMLRAALLPGSDRSPDVQSPGTTPPRYDRIISMAPSITETLFVLDLGDRIVGVTKYCVYPAEALEKAQIGGFIDPNFEAIVSLNPDLAVVLPVHGETIEALAKLDIPTLTVDHRTTEGILESIQTIGDALGAEVRAGEVLDDIHRRIQLIRDKTRGLPRPKVVISAGRDLGSGKIREVYVAGQDQWYNDVITIAGGQNAFTNKGIQFPSLTGEGLLRLQPDIIVEMAPKLDDAPYTRKEVIEQWDAFRDLPAVRDGRVFVLSGSHVTIPGPRFVRVLEDVARVVHPEVDWD